MKIGNSWNNFFEKESKKQYFIELEEKLKAERVKFEIFPDENEVFSAFELCPVDKVRVVIIGQDPYHNNGQANGLAFSVAKGNRLPPSLKNIFKELKDDLGVEISENGDLTHWAKQGVLLMNATLTVRAHEANSHRKLGWAKFTQSVIDYLNTNNEGIIYVVWGAFAYKVCEKIDSSKNTILVSSHPSPLSNKKCFKEFPSFSGSKPFSKINSILDTPINW